MSHTMRRAVVSGALSVLVLTGGATGVASADAATTTSSDTCSAEATAHHDAQNALVQARRAFTAIHGPMNKVLAMQRKEARTELRVALRQLKDVRKRAAASRDKAERKSLREEFKAAAKDARAAARLAHSRRALVAEIKTERTQAKAGFEAAKVTLRDARAAYEDCKDTAANQPPAA